jgi:hypothetical protein
MITNASEFISVNRIDKRLTPFNTGKVQIGLLYQPPPPEMTYSEELIQAALLESPTMHRPPPAWPLILGCAFLSFVLIYFMG